MKRTKKKCQSCKEMISLSNFDRHRSSASCKNGGKNRTKAEKYPWKEWRAGEGLYLLPCGYQGTKKSCTNKLIADTITAEGRSNLSGYNKGIKSGAIDVHNKGKQTPEEQRKKISKAIIRFHKEVGISLETRALLSNARKAYLRNHPEAHPNVLVAGNRNKMTYPERVAHDWFQENRIEAVHNQKVGRYYPDFLVGDLIIEIDGERWHSSPEQVARDSRRDQELKNLGYTVHRIKAKDHIEGRLSEIFNEV